MNAVIQKTKSVSYYRVSTDRQGETGYGLGAQEFSVRHFAETNGYVLEKEFSEVESRYDPNRPILKQALAYCRKHGATLLIAKQDRLAGNVGLIVDLLRAKIKFIDVTSPHDTKFIIYIKAAIDEEERDKIRIRTINALADAKRKGVELGKFGKYILSRRNRLRSRLFARKMIPVIDEIKFRRITTVRDTMLELNRLSIPTFENNGSRWHIATVYKLLRTIKSIQEKPNPFFLMN